MAKYEYLTPAEWQRAYNIAKSMEVSMDTMVAYIEECMDAFGYDSLDSLLSDLEK